MKFYIVTIVCALFFEGISGGVVQSVEEDVASLKMEVEAQLNDLITPLLEGSRELQDRIAAYQIRHSQIDFFSMDSIWGLNITACIELGSVLEHSSGLVENITVTAFDIYTNISGSLNNLTSSCTGYNPYTVIKCYVDNVETLRDEIKTIQPLIKTYQQLVMKLALKVEDTFLVCMGDATVAPSTEKPTPSTEKPTPSTEKPAPSTDKPTPPTDKPTPPTDKPSSTTGKQTTISSTTSNNSKPTTTKKPWWHFW